MKRILCVSLAVLTLLGAFSFAAFAADGDPLDENGDTGGTGPDGGGSLNDYWTGAWQGMRITVIDVSDPAREIGGEQWGKVAAGTVSADITNLDAGNAFFTRTLAGDSSTALTHGSKVTHFGLVSKMEYRDGAALATIVGDYSFRTVTGMPSLMGSNRASAQTIKDYINNQAMLTQIASWCGVGSYDELISGKYKILAEPVLYSLAGTYKYAFTATEAALFRPHGDSINWSVINNTLANAFYLEHDELGWDAWTGSTDINQPFQTIIDSLGMHIYSIAPEDTSSKSIKIAKKSDTGAPLSGARFTVAGNGRNETVTVNGTLTLNLDGWANGSYTVTETAAPSGYEPDTTPQTFTIGDTGASPAELTFINTYITPPPVEIEFRKVEYGTEIGLAGAVFLVTQLSHWEKLLVDPNESENPGEEWELVDPSDNGIPQNNAVVVDKSDDVWEWIEIRETEVVGTFVSGADGLIPVGELEAGSYTIEEISPPAGYVPAETLHGRIQSFDIPREGGYVPGIVFTNRKLPGLTVLKVDEDTGLPLAGAEFSIRHNGNIIYEAVTPANGVINLDGLSEGWYEVTELAAPHGYLIRDGSKDVFLSAGGSAQLKFDNRRKPTLELVKLDAQTRQPLAGATFRVRQTEGNTVGEYTTGADGKVTITDLDDVIYSVEEIAAPDGYLLDPRHKDVKLEWGKVTTLTFTDRKKPGLTITKVDEQTGAALADAEFSVAHKGGAIVYEGKTDGNGKINLTDLAEGWYTITETAAPYGYLIVNTAKDVYLDGDSTVDVRVLNRRRPTLEIIKLDGQTKAPLAGAKFRVWATEGDTVGEYVTDANGRILIPNLDDKIYSAEEIVAPDGYIPDAQTKQILLEWGKVNTLTFTNLKKPTLTIYKYDELTNEPLAGASFRLWKTEGETWSETMVTDANGRIVWTGLDPAIYSIQEIDEPYGYFKDPVRKEILPGGGDNKFLEFFNRPRPTLTILKRDAVTGEPLQDVKFKVQKLEGETIGEFLTDENGKIELSPSTGYLLTEEIHRVTEITPPNEYLLSDNPQKDVLLKWYEPTELVFDNLLKPTLIFIKRDGMSGRGISGATYTVRYESPNGGVTNIGSYDTKCGLIVIPYVLPGWYSLTETSPASGYQLPTNPIQRLHLAPGENSYTYAQTHEDLYVDQRTNPNNGVAGNCELCGYLCSVLCAGNCGNAGDGTMANGGGGTFGNITITNGNGEVIGGAGGGNNGGGAQTDTAAPVLSAGTVTRNGDLTATVQFTSNEAGRSYYAVVNSGANEPTVATSGTGTACVSGANTITVYMTSGARDVYIKVKDSEGNVSNALKISVPAYQAQTETQPETPTTPPSATDPEPTDDTPNPNGGIVWQNPDFPGIVIKFGNY
jgi:5-hydroxyisourate hydrolase-like protein (transthyretin family)/RNase P/RNase MRP subunit p29